MWRNRAVVYPCALGSAPSTRAIRQKGVVLGDRGVQTNENSGDVPELSQRALAHCHCQASNSESGPPGLTLEALPTVRERTGGPGEGPRSGPQADRLRSTALNSVERQRNRALVHSKRDAATGNANQITCEVQTPYSPSWLHMSSVSGHAGQLCWQSGSMQAGPGCSPSGTTQGCVPTMALGDGRAHAQQSP